MLRDPVIEICLNPRLYHGKAEGKVRSIMWDINIRKDIGAQRFDVGYRTEGCGVVDTTTVMDRRNEIVDI